MAKRRLIYIADMGKFRDRDSFEFIAEFANEKLTNNYIDYMRSKERYRKKDIIVIEKNRDDVSADGYIAAVITVLGECLDPEEYGLNE